MSYFLSEDAPYWYLDAVRAEADRLLEMADALQGLDTIASLVLRCQAHAKLDLVGNELPYKPSDDDVSEVQEHFGISGKFAELLLIGFDGDIVRVKALKVRAV